MAAESGSALWTRGRWPRSWGENCPLRPLWGPLPWTPPAPRGARVFQPGLLAVQALCSQQRVSHGTVMTRPRQGSQNRQAAGRGACLQSISPAIWTRTFLSISASVLSLLRDHHSTQLKCLLPSPEGMWRS